MKTNKSPRPDNIYPKILKEGENKIVSGLASLFDKSLRQGLVSTDWKTANTPTKVREIYQGIAGPLA